MLKRSSLELGRKSPNIEMTDLNGAVLNYAVATSSFSLYFKHGQCCCAESRIFMQENLYDDFVAKRVETAKKTKMVDPFHTKTE